MDKAKPFEIWQRPNIGSRVSREAHARFWEHAEVRFLRVTRQALDAFLDVLDHYTLADLVTPRRKLAALLKAKPRPL